METDWGKRAAAARADAHADQIVTDEPLETIAGTGYFALFSKSLSRRPRLSIFAEWLSRRPTRRFECQ